ncbi:MAG: Xaa-Pro peptidase family protein [Acidimicrobiia bacterium]
MVVDPPRWGRRGLRATSPFSDAELAARVGAVKAEMDERGLEALLVNSPENIYYLIGLSHQGYFAFTMLLLPRDGEPALIARKMERHTISQQVPQVRHVGYEDHEEAGPFSALAIRHLGLAGSRIGLDRSSMFLPADVWMQMERDLPGVDWVDTGSTEESDDRFRTGLVDQIRLVKSPAELEQMRRAAAISDLAALAGLEAAGPGVSQKEVAAEVYRAMILGGGEYPGFAPFIRTTSTLREEHSTWQDRALQRGEKLFLELSGSSARYHAPLGRMAFVGEVTPGAEEVRRLAIRALDAVVGALRPGVETRHVYEAWQDVVDEGLGHSRLRRHHCGYSVGIGFPPSWVGSSTVLGIRRDGRARVEAGMAFHILSWITDEDMGDYLVSDTAVVEQDGAHLITTTPRPIEVG